VAAQRDDPGSLLALYRDLIALRRELRGRIELLDGTDDGVLAYRRGGHAIAINVTSEPRRVPPAGDVVLATHPLPEPGVLPPHAGAVALAD
jgi:alpha-glucosidase